MADFANTPLKPQVSSASSKTDRTFSGIWRRPSCDLRYLPIATDAMAAPFPQDPSPRDIERTLRGRESLPSRSSDAKYGM